MEPSLGEIGPYLIAIAALSLLMVHTMVRFSRTLLVPPSAAANPPSGSDPPLAPHGLSARARWGWAYAAAWAALIAAFLSFLAALGDRRHGRNLVLMLLVAAGWLAVNAVLVAFARAILRANQRDAAARGQGRGKRAPAWQVRRERSGSREAEAAGAAPAAASGTVTPDEPLQPTAVDASLRWLRREGPVRRFLRLLANLAVVFAVIAVAELIPPLQRLEEYLLAHRPDYLIPAAAVAGLGFVLLMGGAIHLALTGGRPMSRREIDQQAARVRMRPQDPALFRRSAYRTAGPAAGAAGEDSATFAEVKQAWRQGAWRTSVRWRRIFVMMAGAALMLFGLFGMVIVLAPAGIKLIFAFALVYAVAATARGFARA